MSGIGDILQLLLSALLVVALLFGVRLERKLKALREGQAKFVSAVAELDQAARRTEAGLAQLREAADEAHDGLHDRILKARELKQALEALIARAERVRDAAPAAAPLQVEAAPARAIGSDRVRAAFAAVTEARAQAAARPLPPVDGRPVPVPPTPRPAPRRFDEDLFEPASGDRR